ncbi:protein MAIN-LIKE 1-like [Arachis ipaensis]|uniref:protein MAIN-LIKE 1-like n=1 Tax=Arachis ipaensis TaxID=130454 RepID=UPI0007AFD774|nr:protein MAIN-LIKE 1-like [Arachis ipaensis]
MTCDHPVPPNRYDERVEEHLRSTGFYHVSQIGVVQCQKALVNALVERWHPDTHTFHLSVGECAVSLEEVAMIFGLPTEGLPVTGMALSSFEALEAECTILFGDKSGASVHWKYLPLLSDFASIRQYSWGSACLAHLYRSLCRASRFDCKEIDGPLTLLLCWAWMRLPYLAPVPREPRSFSLANRWRNWERGDRVYRYHKLAHFWKALDELQEGQFLWVAYSGDRVDPDIIPAKIYMHSLIWSATVPLWTNRYNHVLTDETMMPQQPLDTYMYWYRSKYGDHLNLSDLAVQ